MKAGRWAALVLVAAVAGAAAGQSIAAHGSDRERLIGAWRLVQIDTPDGKPGDAPQPVGMLVYTRDGHVSVQLMYPGSGLSNEYVKDGYEASFGSYTVDEAKHTVTHHVMGSNTRGLPVGKDLTRAIEFTKDGQLKIRPANAGEHWSVTWERY